MQVKFFLITVLCVGIISGCQKPASSDLSKLRAHASTHQKSATEGSSIRGLEKGMAYADLKKLVLQSGWTPVVDADCKSNVMGSNYKELCKNENSELCTVCDDLPEVSGCSGDGYCGMYFSKGERRLHVVTSGMIEDWNVPGPTSRLAVDGWDFAGTDKR